MGLLQENGPCFVSNDSNSTYLNPHSWNNEVNLLFIDQPSQVGFSYDIPTNGTRNLAVGEEVNDITPTNFTEGVPTQNNTFLVGTFSSQSNLTTANSTIHAAHAIWHFAQTWFFEFPFYKPHDDRISLWTESYGGRYGPAFFRFFQEQNEKIRNCTISEKGTNYIHLDTLGIVNGLLDAVIQTPAYADMAYNNVGNSQRCQIRLTQDRPTESRHITTPNTKLPCPNTINPAEAVTSSWNAKPWLGSMIQNLVV